MNSKSDDKIGKDTAVSYSHYNPTAATPPLLTYRT